MISANYISNAEFATMNPELDLSQYPDATISGMIQNASAQMDNYLQYTLAVEDVVDEKNEAVVNSEGNLLIFTRKFPIVSVAAITLQLGTAQMVLSLTSGGNNRYEIPYRARNIVYPYQELAFTGTFSIRNFYALRGRQIFTKTSYRAGYDTIPADLKDACSLIAKDIFVRQSNPMNIKAGTQGAVNIVFRDIDADTGESAWIKIAKTTMQSYKKYTG